MAPPALWGLLHLTLTVALLGGIAFAHPMPSSFSQCAEPETDVALIPNLGTLNHPVSTANPRAQAFFNQGLTLLFAYNFEEAVRSFKQAAKADPTLAMAHWGIAMASGANINIDVDSPCEAVAYAAIGKAKQVASQHPTTDAERAYINALATRYTGDAGPDRVRLAVNFKLAQQALVQSYPRDHDARTVYVEALMDLRPWMLWLNGKPNTDTTAILDNLSAILTADPYHLGANHYQIHALEASTTPERALTSALVLPFLSPNAGHIQHMPSHIFMRLGHYRMSRDANLSALKVDQPYYGACFPQRKPECLPLYTGHYYTHNLMFLAESYGFMGSSMPALETARKAQQNALAFIEGQPELEHYVAGLSVMQVAFHKWEDILQEPAPRPSLPAATALWRWARSYAYAKKGDLKQARDEQQAFFAALQQVPYDLPYGNNSAQTFLGVASNLLRARIAAGEGQKDAAVELLKLAVDSADALAYDEPPPWFFPARDALAAAYYQAGRYQESAATFQKSLDLQPLNPRALYGLAQSQKAAGNPGWQDAQSAFEQAARDGDVQYSIDGLW